MLNQHMIFVLFWGGGAGGVEILPFGCVLGAASVWACVCGVFCFVLFVFLCCCFFLGGGYTSI